MCPQSAIYQTANYVVHAEDLPCAVPGRTIVYCLKTMARRASPAHALQSYQSGQFIAEFVTQKLKECKSQLSKILDRGWQLVNE